MLLSILLSVAASATTDTLVVKTAQMEGPYTIQSPYSTDSLNTKGQPFDIKEALGSNAKLIKTSGVRKPVFTNINQGYHFTLEKDSLPAMRILRFNLQADRYTKAHVNIKGISNYKLYVNDKESSNDLTLTPGRAELALQIFTQKTDKDSFDVSITGKDLAGLQIGRASCRERV